MIYFELSIHILYGAVSYWSWISEH